MSSRLRHLTIGCLLILLGSLVAGDPAEAQKKPPAAPPASSQPAQKPAPSSKAAADASFIDIVNVSVVNVDVYVTDKKGSAVTGLTKDDFELSENGRPVQITNFYSVTNGKATAPGTETATAAPAVAAPGPAGTLMPPPPGPR